MKLLRNHKVELHSKPEKRVISTAQMQVILSSEPILYSIAGQPGYYDSLDELFVEIDSAIQLKRFVKIYPKGRDIPKHHAPPMLVGLGYVVAEGAIEQELTPAHSFVFTLPRVSVDLDPLKEEGFKIVQRSSDLSKISVMDESGTPPEGWTKEQEAMGRQMMALKLTRKRKNIITIENYHYGKNRTDLHRSKEI